MNETNSTKRLTRSRDDRFIGGVAAGIANYFNLDPVLVRVAFVISIAFGGIGVVAYLALLLLVPIEGDQDAPAVAPSGAKRFWVIAGTVILGLLALISIDTGGPSAWFFGIGPGPLFGILIWGLVIYGIYWLVRRTTKDDGAQTGAFGRPPASSTPPATPAPVSRTERDAETAVLEDGRPAAEAKTTEVPTAVTTTMANAPTQNAPTTPLVSPPGTPAQRNLNDSAPSTIGKIMTWFAIGMAALVGFSVLAVISAGMTAILGAIPMASLVIVLGGGLIFAAIRNRRHLAAWMLAAALVIAIPMAGISIADLRIEGTYGESTEEPRAVSDIPSEGFEMAAGVLTVDLREYPFRKGEPVSLPIESGMGATRVIVPNDICVAGQVQGKAGLADIRGFQSSGFSVDRSFSQADPKLRSLNLDADFKLGFFEVIDETVYRQVGDLVDQNDEQWEQSLDNSKNEGVNASARERARIACTVSTPVKDAAPGPAKKRSGNNG